MRKIIFIIWSGLFLNLMLSSCYKEYFFITEENINDSLLFINNHEVFFDLESKTALLSVSNYDLFEAEIVFNQFDNVELNEMDIKNGEKFDFGKIDANSTFSLAIKKNNISEHYSLQFTLLPIIQIEHNFPKIPDEPKIIARFKFSQAYSDIDLFEICGIELRGGSAAIYTKKSYSVEFYKDSKSNEEKNISLLDMYDNSNWILDATYIDKSNFRNKASFDIWSAIQSNALLNKRQTMPSAIEGRFIELFINNHYLGLYNLNERVDEKKLSIKNKTTQAYLYKSEGWSQATKLNGLPDTVSFEKTWSEWEIKLPDYFELYCWSPLYEYVDFISNSSDEIFQNNISNYIQLDQAIDFFILINLIKGYDNAGKNIFLAKKSASEPFYLCPWDMDATWGRNWKGEAINAEGIVTFNLYKRLMEINPDNYNLRLKDRWFNLRHNELQTITILNYFENYSRLIVQSGAFGRERQKWPESLNNADEEHEYISDWLVKRLEVLDKYFEQLDK